MTEKTFFGRNKLFMDYHEFLDVDEISRITFFRILSWDVDTQCTLIMSSLIAG